MKINLELNQDDQIDGSIQNDISVLLQKTDITKEELAAAYLTLFFESKITQEALTTIIKLSNITSAIKLPTSFDGLLNILTNKDILVDYQKSWFCGNCLKHISSLESRLQRICLKCNTRYRILLFLNIKILKY